MQAVERNPLSLEDNMGLVHTESMKIYKKMIAIGCNDYEYDDVLQLGMMTFVRATERYDENNGAKFSTYYVNAMRNEGLKLIEKYNTTVRTVSVDAFEDNEGDEFDAYSLMPSEMATPEEHVVRVDYARHVMATLKPMTRTVLRCLVKPPYRIKLVFERYQDYIIRANSEGASMQVPKEIDINFICKCYRMSRTETDRVKDELRKAVGDNTLWRYSTK